MLDKKKTTLSICLTCRDGLEDIHTTRGGKRFSDKILKQKEFKELNNLEIRGVKCMSQCKRSCIISLTAENSFTYMFGDINPANPKYFKSLTKLILLFNSSPDGFLKRNERPELFQSNILGRFPPLDTNSALVICLDRET